MFIAGIGLTAMVKSRIGLAGFLCLAMMAGLWRGQVFFEQQNYMLQAKDLVGSRGMAVGRVIDTPRWNDDRLYEFYLGDVKFEGRPVEGAVKIKSLSGSVSEGQIVSARGKLGRALGRAESQIWYADVQIISATPPLPTRVKKLLTDGMERALPKDSASLAQGLVFGGQRGLSRELQAASRAAGLTHIVAVSGYNLTIIVLLVLALSRRRHLGSVVVALGLIICFVVMTGASASVVRAGVMAGLVLIVGLSRRKLDNRVALGVTILAMTMWSPRYLYSDLSWQLSVLALVGVLFLAPALLPRSPKRHTLLWEMLTVSLAAHLATAPLIAYIFGGFSLVAPLANLIVLPLIPLAMLAAFLAGILGMFLPASWLAITLPFSFIIRSVEQLILVFGTLPQALAPVSMDWLAMMISYGGIAMMCLLALRKTSKKTSQQL